MKFYKVVLNAKNNANADQIIDGCLGNIFEDGKVAEYTRGEAMKKAKSFGGKIELSKEVKAVYVQLNNRVGEESSTIKVVHELSIDTDTKEFAWELAKQHYGDADVEYASNEYYHNGGTVATSVLKVEEIPYEDYIVMKKYL